MIVYFYAGNRMAYLFKFVLILVLSSGAYGNKDYSNVKLTPLAKDHLEQMSALMSKDRYTGCLCPASLNSKGSYYTLCGHELNPKAGGICAKEGSYRCVNNQPEAILQFDCAEKGGGLSCVESTTCVLACKEHNVKGCKRLVKYTV